MNVTLAADASFCPRTLAAGWGTWIVCERGRVKGTGGFKVDPACSRTAEMMAIVKAIAFGVRRGMIHVGDIVLVQSDCVPAITFLQKRRQNLAELDQSIVEAYDRLLSTAGITVEFRHVKAHTSRSGKKYFINDVCDQMAKSAMRGIRASRT